MELSTNALSVLKMAEKLKEEERKEVIASLLDQLHSNQPKGTALCNAVMRIWATPAFEAVAFRKFGRTVEVYLRQRSLDDTAYPGQWHVPGSLFRSGETKIHVEKRLESEFGTPIQRSTFVSNAIISEQRGTVHSMIFLVLLADNPRIDSQHRWFDVSEMPENTVKHHRETIIPMAEETYRKLRR